MALRTQKNKTAPNHRLKLSPKTQMQFLKYFKKLVLVSANRSNVSSRACLSFQNLVFSHCYYSLEKDLLNLLTMLVISILESQDSIKNRSTNWNGQTR